MATPLPELTKLLPALGKTGAYEVAVAGSTVSVTLEGDEEPILVADLDGKGSTFHYAEQKSGASAPDFRGTSRMPSFEAGGLYRAAKRRGLAGHRPSRKQLQETLTEFFTRNGWTRVR